MVFLKYYALALICIAIIGALGRISRIIARLFKMYLEVFVFDFVLSN